MGQHLTPTQKRLTEKVTKYGRVFVRVIKPRGALPLNQYEADQLVELDKMRKLRIIRSYHRGAELTLMAVEA